MESNVIKAIRITPFIRSSLIENSPLDEVIFFFHNKSDFDLSLIEKPDLFKRFKIKLFIKHIRNPDIVILAISEPLWYRYWFHMLFLSCAVKVIRFLSGLEKVNIVSYAIENLSWRDRLTLPYLDRWQRTNQLFSKALRRFIVISSNWVLDGLAFGTKGAQKNYEELFAHEKMKFKKKLVMDYGNLCPCMKDNLAVEKRKQILFLGEKSERKGFYLLLNVWDNIALQYSDWELICIGTKTQSVGDNSLLRFSDLEIDSRSEIHEFLRECLVVVLPSQRIKRWREQVGLPIVEGLSHGCRVIASRESGLFESKDLQELVDWCEPGDYDSFLKKLREVLDTFGTESKVQVQIAELEDRLQSFQFDVESGAERWFHFLDKKESTSL